VVMVVRVAWNRKGVSVGARPPAADLSPLISGNSDLQTVALPSASLVPSAVLLPGPLSSAQEGACTSASTPSEGVPASVSPYPKGAWVPVSPPSEGVISSVLPVVAHQEGDDHSSSTVVAVDSVGQSRKQKPSKEPVPAVLVPKRNVHTTC